MAQASTQVQAAVRPVEVAREARPERHVSWWHLVVYLFLAIFTITSIGPLIFSFISSFKSMSEVLTFPPTIFPRTWITSNYATILGDPRFLRWILNVFIYAGAATVLNLLFSSMAGYALSRLNFPGRNVIFVVTLAVMMIPLAVTLIPKFLIINNLHLVALGTQDMYTLPLGLFYFFHAHYTEYNLLIASSMFNTIPILILFFIFQRYFIEGAVSSGVKG